MRKETWEYQALKLVPFLHANTQYPDEQNATDRSGSNLNVTELRNQSRYTFCSAGRSSPKLGQPKAAANWKDPVIHTDNDLQARA